MKRMIDNKDYDLLKDNVKDINEELELKDTNYIITSVVVEGEEVEGFIIKDVENEVNYNIDLGGGKQLYQHNIRISKNDYSQPINVYTTIISSSATVMDKTAFKDYIFTNFPTANDAMLLANGTFNNDKFTVIGIKQTTPQGQGTTYVGFIYLDSSNDIQHIEWSQSSYTITDSVIAL